MNFTVEVTSLTSGAAEEESPLPAVDFSFDHEVVTTRELIARTVEEQVRLLNNKAEESTERKRAILERRYLSEADIEALAREGRINAPEDTDLLDVDRELQKALYGFKKQRFFVTVNGWQPESLDDNVLLTEHSRVAFIRLIPLAGG